MDYLLIFALGCYVGHKFTRHVPDRTTKIKNAIKTIRELFEE